MTQPRSSIVSLQATPYYHCITRCVRRAFLCGNDYYSGKSYDHRKPWFIDRLNLLTKAFCIDIAAFAVMSNHYHVVLHVNERCNKELSKNEVIYRWLTLYKGPDIIHRYLRGEQLTDEETDLANKQVATWRARLNSISWFMKCLNEYVARKANQEDNCKGRFWESRFKSQALLDEAALISCMAYVDLNPVRAGISKDIESSWYTSVRQRIKQAKRQIKKPGPRLMPFLESIGQQQNHSGIPYTLQSYLELLDWTGRSIRKDKRGFITAEQPSLIATLGLSREQWQFLALEIQKESQNMLNGLDKLAAMDKRARKRQIA